MTLQPGDRSIHAVMRPVFPNGLTTRGSWPCTACGEQFDAWLTWAVVYARPEQDVPYVFMACPEYADALTPLRLRLVQQRLGAFIGPPSSEDRVPRTARVVADHVTWILAARQEAPPDVMQLWAIDTHLLADRLGITQADLVRRLGQLDALAEIHVPTRPVPTQRTTCPTGRSTPGLPAQTP